MSYSEKPGFRFPLGADPEALAYLKARSVAADLPADTATGTVVLGADTTVLAEGEVIGQPRDEQDARAILRRLAGGRHEVVSGAAMVCGRWRRIRLCRWARRG